MKNVWPDNGDSFIEKESPILSKKCGQTLRDPVALLA